MSFHYLKEEEQDEDEEYDPEINYKSNNMDPPILLKTSSVKNGSSYKNNQFYLKRKSNLIQTIDLPSVEKPSRPTEMNVQVSLASLPETHYISTLYWDISKQYLLYLFYVKWCFQVLLHKILLDEYYYFKSEGVHFRIIYISKLIDQQQVKSINDLLHSETIYYFKSLITFYGNFSDFEKDSSSFSPPFSSNNIHIFIFEDMNLLSNHFQSEESLKYLFEKYFFYFTETIPCIKKLIIGSTWNANALFAKVFKKHQSKLNQNHISSLLNDFYLPFYYTHLFSTNLTHDFNSFGIMYFRNEKLPSLIKNEKTAKSIETILSKEYFVIPETFKDYAKKYNYKCVEWTSWQEWFYVNYTLDENQIYHHWLTQLFHHLQSSTMTHSENTTTDFQINNADPDIWNELSFQGVFVLEKFH